MSNKRGQLACFTKSKNTGFGSCFLDWKQIVGAFIFDNPRTFTNTEIAALEATLQAQAALDVKANRMFPIHNFVAPTDGSEKVIVETFDYGAKAIVRDGDIDWTFQFVDGGGCLNKAGRTHNGKRWVLFYDKENKLMGYNKSDSFATIPTQFVYFHPFSLATGSKTAAYMVQFVFLAKYANEESDFVKAAFDLSEIEGLQDIDILVNSWNQYSGVANVTLQIACGSENIYDLFHSQIVVASFKATDQDGNTVTISSVTGVAGSKTFNIAFAVNSLPDGGTLTLSGALVSALTAQGIAGYEIGSVDLVTVESD